MKSKRRGRWEVCLVMSGGLLLPGMAWPQSVSPPARTGEVQATQQSAQERLQVQIKDLESQVTRIQQEEQATYQQFQLAQEMRRNMLQQADMATSPYAIGNSIGGMGTVPNYDDVVRMRQAQQAQIQQYTDDMNSLYGRFRELETRKQILQDRIDNLRRQLAPMR